MTNTSIVKATLKSGYKQTFAEPRFLKKSTSRMYLKYSIFTHKFVYLTY